MDADLDSLLTVVLYTADDLLPTKPGNARRMVTDAEVVTLDSTPVETARSRETVTRAGDSALADAIGDAAGYGYCASHPRYFYGMRLHLLTAPDGTPVAATLWSPERGEREIAIGPLARCPPGTKTIIAEEGYAGVEFQNTAARLGATIVRPNRKDEPGQAPIISGIRQRIESIINTTKDILGLERHGARTLHNLRVRVCVRLSRSPPASPTTTTSASPAAISPRHRMTVTSLI
jgi:hypothetical protein